MYRNESFSSTDCPTKQFYLQASPTPDYEQQALYYLNSRFFVNPLEFHLTSFIIDKGYLKYIPSTIFPQQKPMYINYDDVNKTFSSFSYIPSSHNFMVYDCKNRTVHDEKKTILVGSDNRTHPYTSMPMPLEQFNATPV